jgi:hypothetical protein
MSESQDAMGSIGGVLMAIFSMFICFIMITEGCIKGKPMPKMNMFQRVEPEPSSNDRRLRREYEHQNGLNI